jgi:hypothetical protein
VRGRETITEAIVLVAVDLRQTRLADGAQAGTVISVAGRSCKVHLPSLDAATVLAAIQPLVRPASEIHTDFTA